MSISNKKGLSADILKDGTIRRITAGNIRIGMRDANPFSLFGTNLYLRLRKPEILYKALIGPESNSDFAFNSNYYISKGKWNELEYRVTLWLSGKKLNWLWNIEIVNGSNKEIEIDIVAVQDIGLKQPSQGTINEYYVSQYVEKLILDDAQYGKVVCCRQNMKEENKNPWIMVACSNGAYSAATDGMLFYGKSYRKTKIPEALLKPHLEGEYAGESSIISIQSKPYKIEPKNTYSTSFLFHFEENHALATSATDLLKLPELFKEFENISIPQTLNHWKKTQGNIFISTPNLIAESLSDSELNWLFGKERRFSEFENGKLLSFFYGNSLHVILRDKEILTDRPHGNILQANVSLFPNESIMSCTTFAYGTFCSHLTQGNTNFNNLLSVNSSQFNLSLETGLRIFVEIDNTAFILAVPSAFEMGINFSRWFYKYKDHLFQIRTWTSHQKPQVNIDFKVLKGDPVNIKVSCHFDEINGWELAKSETTNQYILAPSPLSPLGKKFPNSRFRLCIINPKNHSIQKFYDQLDADNATSHHNIYLLDIPNTNGFWVSFIGEVKNTSKELIIHNADEQFIFDFRQALQIRKQWGLNFTIYDKGEEVNAITEIVPWFVSNALVHYLTPYGLEQFSGAAWGTRDVSQGPIELLISLGRFNEVREILLKIFSNQNIDGWWPQWWMFDSYSSIRAHEAHGDIAYWCLIALSNYILSTADTYILNEKIPYFNPDTSEYTNNDTLYNHVEKLISKITHSFIPGTTLVPFGGGDWNDSLQPVSTDLAQRMVSSWTVEMNYQAFSLYQQIYRIIGRAYEADKLLSICNRIKEDFNTHLVKNGVVAGYGLLEQDGTFSPLLHPNDTITKIHYSLLPFNRGIISNIFTKEQAEAHLEIIRSYLTGPDGVRLMDKPLKYKGGLQEIFQRAESSTFFGREIGLMYTHELIRYAESLAIMGKADELFKAIRKVIPIDYKKFVTPSDIRQSNCYYSSSDVIFKTRYEADELYDDLIKGKLTFRGGWRVYSSGPGIFLGLLISRLLGIRLGKTKITIDPVLPLRFDGLKAMLNINNRSLQIIYHIKNNCYGPEKILVNGEILKFVNSENIYRKGGAIIETKLFENLTHNEVNTIDVFL